MKIRMSISAAATGAALLIMAACGDGTGPTTGAEVSLTFGSGVTGSGAAVASFVGPMAVVEVSDGLLVIESVEVLLREIELERVEVADCDDVDPDPPECEDFETGFTPIDLALDGSMTTMVPVIMVPAGMYDEVEFDIHKASADDPDDAAFLADNSEWEGRSIVVTGMYDGSPFVYETDLNEEQELPLDLEVTEDGASTNVTIVLDVSTWFVDASGNAFNPETALKGEPNENLAKDNIKDSIEAFEDADRDGDHTDE